MNDIGHPKPRLLYVIQTRVTPDDEVRIARAAERQNRSVAALLRHIIRSYLDLIDSTPVA